MFTGSLPAGGWFVAPGKLKDGTKVDLMKEGAPLSWAKPKPMWKSYKTERWRKYLFHLYANNKQILHYARFLCRSWNADHHGEKQLDSLEIVYMSREHRSNGSAQFFKENVLFHFNCREPGKRS